MRTLTSTLLLLCLTAAVFADAPSHVHKYAGYSSLGAYEPARPKSLNDIPESVRTKLVAHLKKRLGEPFYSSLQLCGGQIVAFAEFHRRESGWKDYKWEVFAYNLHFEFRLADKGIEFYQASIRLRADGSVIEDIDLPNIAQHPERAAFVPLSSAVQAATAAGFDISHCEIEIAYRPKDDRCVYSFQQLVRRDGPSLYFKCVDVDAHTGKQLRIFKQQGTE